MNELFTLKLFPLTAFIYMANGPSVTGGLIEIAAKNGVLALCLVGLALHTAKERDKDRADKKEKSTFDREERVEERLILREVLQRQESQIGDLQKMLYDKHKI